jgi:hypothetical protein
MYILKNPLDWSQDSTAILQADSRADLPNGFMDAKILSTRSLTIS